ncbi:MAG: EF-hand domain-containing protein [Gammaproteobacteria bacterium]|nr:EF-hand domain-containing protein [Gammaproteobacteria bacterium]MBU1654272.1 EF-hand domain-containing protein [Gammaproteobacteria bacterium]MBU1960645.1 EF-hand domain-containing protein [Gammaproteobacteria bacterium]
MKKPRLLTLTLLIALSCGVTAMASWSAEIPAWGPIPFEAFDRDGNGLISEAEFNQTRSERMGRNAAEGRPMWGAASAPAFKDMDTNGDGNLTAEEHTAAQQAHMQQRGGRGMGPRGGMGR